MKESLRYLAAEINNKNRKKRMWLKLISVLCCATIFCTSYAMILPAISLGTDEENSGSDTSFVPGLELLKSYEKVDGGDLSDTVHWIIEDVKDAFGTSTRQVRIYGEGEMPGSTPWKTYKDSIQKAVIEDGITNISNEAFNGMTKLVSAKLGNDITVIGQKAFSGCSNFASVNIPDSVIEIQNSAFGGQYDNSPLSELKLNEGLKKISGKLGGKKVTSIYIPKTVTYMPDDVFDFNSLTEVIIDDENTAYKTDPQHKSVLTKDGKTLIRVLRNATGDYTIPDGVTTIKSRAILSCNICSVKFENMTDTVDIQSGNFQSCNNIRELNFPPLKSWVGGDWDIYLVAGCKTLYKVTFSKIETVDSNKFAHHSLFDCPALKEVVFPDEVYETVTSLGAWVFKNTALSGDVFAKFTNLKTLNNNMGYPVDNAVFSNCKYLDKIVLGEKLNQIQNGIFNNCLNVKEIVLNSKMLTAKFASKTGGSDKSFQNLPMCSKLTIGKTVDKLNKSLMDAIFDNNIKDVVFEGPNVLEIDSGIDAPSPIGELGGTYYADADGVLYKLDSESNTATLAYFPTGFTSDSYTVPDTITADNAAYSVTQVGSDAFLGSKLKSVSFENSSAVTLLNNAFYECENLESVNGKSDITEVKALFGSVGSGVFFGTKLTGSPEKNKGTATTDVLTVIKGDESANFQIGINATKFSFYTDETQTINVSVSNSSNSEEGIGRIYIQFGGSNYNLPATVGETLNNNGFEYSFHQSDIEGIYYYEFNKPASGATVGFSFLLSYPSPESAGGKVQVWSKILEPTEAADLGNGVKFTDDSEFLHEYEWKTVPRNITVNETVSNNGLLIGSGQNDQKSYVSGMEFTVSADSTNTGREDIESALGNDLIRSYEFTATLTLPEDFRFDEEIKTAIENGNYFCVNSKDNNKRITNAYVGVVVGGKSVTVLTFNNLSYNTNADNVSIEFPEGNARQLIVKIKLLNSSNSTEIDDYNFKVGYKQGLFYAQKTIISGDTFSFDHKVDVVNNYAYSEPKASSAIATANVTAGEANLKITKTDSSVGYLSDKQSYRINLSNSSASTYTDFSYLTDALPQYVYIPAADIQRMMSEEYGGRLSVTISNAQIALNASSIHGNTEKSVDGNDCKITNQNTGYEIPYSGASAQGTDVGIVTGTISVYWKNGNLYAKYNDDEKQVDVSDADSLNNTFDEFGFFVTRDARYTLKWDFSYDFEMYGGKTLDLAVYSMAMDTFMMLYDDREGTYMNEYVTFDGNTAFAYNSADQKVATSTSTGRVKHYREISLKHAMFKNNSVVDSNSGLANADIIQQTAFFRHTGTGTYGALPLVNRISRNLLLLVSKNLNKDSAQLSAFETTTVNGAEYYVLKYNGTPMTLTDVYTGKNQLASKISLKENGTIVHWYFDNLPASSYIKSVDYLTMIDASKETEVKWNINVESWLNDHQTHRLHLISGADAISLDFDKKIVTNPAQIGIDGYFEMNSLEAEAFNTLKDTQTLDTFSYIGEGNAVTYLLQLKSRGSNVTVRGSDIYDCMPWKYDWMKPDNVSIKYVYEQEKATVTNPNSWSITKDDPTTLAVEDGEYSYIVWADDFTVTLQGDAQLFMYVTLSFPTGEPWDAFVVDNNGATLHNRFYLLGVAREVSHELKLPVKARIQKGVYELGSARRLWDDGGTTLQYYKSAGSRQYYMNTDSRNRFVTYYATVYNSGYNKMYLNDMQDMLPKGFKYRFLTNCTETIPECRNTNMISTNAEVYINGVKKTIFEHGKTLAAIEGATLVTATVAASVSNRSEDYQKITFKFSKAASIKGEATLKYDETYGKYYLNPGEAICFGYLCSISTADKTVDTATNYIALPIDDMGEGVFVNGEPSVASSDNGLDKNDGSCDVMSNDVAESLGFNGYGNDTKWLKSDVSVTRGDVVPEIGKKAVTRTNTSGDSFDYTGFARPEDKITWKITARNGGEYSLMDYTISDTMQKMDNVLYRFEGYVNYAVYEKGNDTANFGAGGRQNLMRIDRDSGGIKAIKSEDDSSTGFREKGSTGNFGDALDIEYGKDYEAKIVIRDVTQFNAKGTFYYCFRFDKDENGVETISIHFTDDFFAIPAGGRAEMMLTVARVDSTLTTPGHFRNDVQLIPNAENAINSKLTNYDRVMSSEKVKSDGTVIGVANSSSFDIVNGYGTTSVKTVTELNPDGTPTDNTASSENSNNTITLSDTESNFQYKSSVHLPKEVATKEFVLIDTLPEVGDHSVFEQEDSRGSQFNVKFIDYTPVVELLDADGNPIELVKGTDYTVDYSTKTVFAGADWLGTSTFDSTVDPSTHRAIRLKVTKEIPKDATINLYYRAVASSPETVKEGEIAYSSFGYSYQVSVDGFARQEAAPLKVGVRASNIAYLSKQLSTRDGTAYTPETDETFKFIVYKGNSVNLSGSDEAQLAQKLNGIEYTVVTLTVAAGESESDSVALSGLKQYTYSETDGFTESTADWELTANEKYTVYEYGYSDAYLFKDFSKNDNSNYTFTYMPETAQRFVCENILKTWQVSVVKKDADDENIKLQGAVFGLYSTNPLEVISDADLGTLVTELGLSGTPSKTETVMIDDTQTTVYLKAVSATDELGVVSWTDLLNPKYAVKELKAPDGYIINENKSTPNLRLISQPEVISLDSYTSVAGYTNKTYYTLPKTGGIGTVFLYVIGVLLIAASVFLYVKRRMHGRRIE